MSYGVDTRKRRSPLILGLFTVGLGLGSLSQGGLIGLGLGALAFLFGIWFLLSLGRPPELHGFGQTVVPTATKRSPVDISIPDAAPKPQPIPHNLMAEVDALLARGAKIEAIKLYREQMGVGLKEAKDAVEARERQNTGMGRNGSNGPWG